MKEEPLISSTEITSAKSKKALKRQRRQDFLVEVKKRKKLAEKEKKKAGKLNQEPRPPREQSSEPAGPSRLELKNDRKVEFLTKALSNFSVIVDCAWDSHLVGRPLKSLSQQILFCYGVNRKAETPCKLYITGMNSSLREQLNKSCLSNWVGVYPYSEEYLALPFFGAEKPSTDQTTAAAAAATSNDANVLDSLHPAKQLVYLTSDAEDTIETLDDDTAYIIGGIVDRNRLKGATYTKACGQNVRTAKLPIKEHMAMSCTHVLTVNHVFEILLHFKHCGSWSQSISAVLPQRKGAKARISHEGGDGDASEESSVGDEDDGHNE